MREQVHQLIAEGGDAARFEANDGNPGTDPGAKGTQCLAPEMFGGVEHAEVVERTPAAQWPGRDLDRVPGVFEHVDGGIEHRGAQVVVEGVGPQQDAVGLERRGAAVRMRAVLVGSVAQERSRRPRRRIGAARRDR